MRLFLIGLLMSSSLIAGDVTIKRDKKMPKIKLNSGQISMLEKYMDEVDKSGTTEHIRLDFVCSKNKKKKFLGDKYNCELKEIN